MIRRLPRHAPSCRHAALAALLLSFAAWLLLRPRACPPHPAFAGDVAVLSSRYLLRGNVGHWGYALFGLHAQLLTRPPPSGGLTLHVGGGRAAAAAGDWVATTLSALSRRHGAPIRVSPSACTPRSPWTTVDANDATRLGFGREPGLVAEFRAACGLPPLHSTPRRDGGTDDAADVLIYDRAEGSSRRLCGLEELRSRLEALGLSHVTTPVPPAACDQVRVLGGAHAFVITPHGAHEVNLWATHPNATVIEVMPHNTDIPIYNRLVATTVWMVSEQVEEALPCIDGACAHFPPSFGDCTRRTLCRKAARNTPCVRVNRNALEEVLLRKPRLREAEDALRRGVAAAAAQPRG